MSKDVTIQQLVTSGKLAGLKEPLAAGLKPSSPIQLSPKTPFVAGKAGLVFVSPHVVDAGKDNVIFGWLEPNSSYGASDPHPPHQDARVVAWFRPPIVPRKYVVEFVFTGRTVEMLWESSAIHNFTLVNSLDSDSVSSPWDEGGEQHLAALVEPTKKDWINFTLSATNCWRLVRVAITGLE